MLRVEGGLGTIGIVLLEFDESFLAAVAMQIAFMSSSQFQKSFELQVVMRQYKRKQVAVTLLRPNTLNLRG